MKYYEIADLSNVTVINGQVRCDKIKTILIKGTEIKVEKDIVGYCPILEVK